jgi:two-component system, LuxR family, response regulator FixJ
MNGGGGGQSRRLPHVEPLMNAPLKVLLVDDDPAIRASLTFSLELEGFDVEAFASAEAVADQAGLSTSNCLVVDYRLPGMDGLALLALLRGRGIPVPAVMITSNPPRRLRARALEAGIDIVEKPLLSDALAKAIRNLTDAPARIA